MKFNSVLEWENFTKKNFLTRFLHQSKYSHLKNSLDRLSINKINILDLGCGFADTFNILNSSYQIQYTGIENNKQIVTETNKRYKIYKNFNLINESILEFDSLFKNKNNTIIILFDVLEHINLRDRFLLLEKINNYKFDKMYINVPNEVSLSILLKNFGSKILKYDRYKEYNLYETFNSFLGKIEKFSPHIDQHKGFDWRVLKYMLHYFFEINQIYTSFHNYLPKFMSPSILFECQNRKIK